MDQSFAQIADESFNIPVSGFAYTVPPFNRLDLVRVKADVMRPISPDRGINSTAAAVTLVHFFSDGGSRSRSVLGTATEGTRSSASQNKTRPEFTYNSLRDSGKVN